MGYGNSFPLVVRLSTVILACKSIELCKCSGNVLIGYWFLVNIFVISTRIASLFYCYCNCTWTQITFWCARVNSRLYWCLDTCSSWEILIFYDSSLASYFEFGFSSLFQAVLPLGFSLSSGKSVKYRFIEFFVFDHDSLPYLLSLFSSQASLFL